MEQYKNIVLLLMLIGVPLEVSSHKKKRQNFHLTPLHIFIKN